MSDEINNKLVAMTLLLQQKSTKVSEEDAEEIIRMCSNALEDINFKPENAEDRVYHVPVFKAPPKCVDFKTNKRIAELSTKPEASEKQFPEDDIRKVYSMIMGYWSDIIIQELKNKAEEIHRTGANHAKIHFAQCLSDVDETWYMHLTNGSFVKFYFHVALDRQWNYAVQLFKKKGYTCKFNIREGNVNVCRL
jgi:hypothetical protein